MVPSNKSKDLADIAKVKSYKFDSLSVFQRKSMFKRGQQMLLNIRIRPGYKKQRWMLINCKLH